MRSGRRHAAVHAALRPAMARGVRRRHRHAAVGQSARGPASGSLCVSAIGTALQNTVHDLLRIRQFVKTQKASRCLQREASLPLAAELSRCTAGDSG